MILLNTVKVPKILRKLTDYYRVIQLTSPERVGRLRRTLTKKRKYLKEQAFEKFNIPYESFHNILNDHEKDKLIIQFFQGKKLSRQDLNYSNKIKN
ncbi:hypothetical protein BpHYR1_043501 [Brachionus plicatilis]|uniref:Uncharacterized protein n=1 Tax=Brachionus plicatilis TaxID=10195 RepID=A0A3M7PQM4_BRAPC|nr:hypothetical protein BpHYR1_043501 [Brachionus plicatilis]